MAEAFSPKTPEKGSSKTVQEMVEINSYELPDGYIWRDDNSDYGPVDLTVPLATDIPVVDVGRLISSSSATDAELAKLRSALSSWGCFQAVNHGIENSFLDQVRQLAEEFFHLPMSEKQRHATPEDDTVGYGNDKILFENQPLDWTDREVLHEYTSRLRKIQEQLLKSMARSLSLPEECFLNKYGDRPPTMYARFNYYPPCSRPDCVLGLKPHADGSAITILLQDKQVQGLQVLKDNQWFSVPIMPHALLVNVGDQVEIMSNGIFKSPIHRAVTNSERERKTVAMFCFPDPSREIEPLEELVDEKRPRLFKKVQNYPETYFHYYQQGKRPIDAVRI